MGDSGLTCKPSCDSGYVLSGLTSCDLGNLTVATCQKEPSVAEAEEEAAATAGSIVGAVLVSCCCCCVLCPLACCLRKKENRYHAKGLYRAAKEGDDITDHLLPFFPSWVAHRIGGEPEAPLTAAGGDRPALVRDILRDTRYIICFSHSVSTTGFIQAGIQFLKEVYALEDFNFIYQDLADPSVTPPEWRWQWIVGALVSRKVVAIVDDLYVVSERNCNEFLAAGSQKKRVVVLRQSLEILFGDGCCNKGRESPGRLTDMKKDVEALVKRDSDIMEGQAIPLRGDVSVDSRNPDLQDLFDDIIHMNARIDLDGRKVLAMRLRKKALKSGVGRRNSTSKAPKKKKSIKREEPQAASPEEESLLDAKPPESNEPLLDATPE